MDTPWYHGSPYRIDVLREGSTITQDQALARAFSHKPAVLSLEDDGPGPRRIRHNGTLAGLLYVVDEPLDPQDVYPHPNSSMPSGLECLTRRPLRLRLLGAVDLDPEEYLSDAEIQRLRGT